MCYNQGMKQYVLSYYPEFKCVASECKHTCCAGWKMNIDSDTLTAYKKVNTPFSERLNSGIDYKKSQFKADKKGRCAFLNDKNLCEIIINLGDESLCQVCRDHPRFRSFFDDRVEMGLGFSCEIATKIILSHESKIEAVLISDDNGKEENTFIQECVLKFRARALEIVQDRTLSANDRLDNLLSLCNAKLSQRDKKKILKTFLSLERLDKGWTARLKAISKKPFIMQTDDALSLYFEQFFTNSFYRYLSDAEDTISVRARAFAVVLAWWVINAIFECEKQNTLQDFTAFNLICDIVRQYSAEVEYSQKNLNKLFNFANKYIKI